MRRLAWAPLLVALSSLVVALTVRDGLPVLDLVYYAVPPPVAALLLFLGCPLLAMAAHRPAALASALAAIVAVALWLPQQFGRAECVERSDGVRVVFWNLARGVGGWERVISTLAEQNADIIGLVESGYHVPDPVTFWRRAFPGYDVVVPGRGMAILARGRIRGFEIVRLAEQSYLARAPVETNRGTVQLILVDLEANLLTNRGQRLTRFRQAVLEPAEAPTVILGDFNTPSSSRGFDGLRARYTNLWEARGVGYAPTWPLPVPYLTIDQMWFSSGVRPLCARRLAKSLSDHALLVGEISIDAAAAQRPAP